METQGMIADPTTPEAFAVFIHDEVVNWGGVIRAAGVRLEEGRNLLGRLVCTRLSESVSLKGSTEDC